MSPGYRRSGADIGFVFQHYAAFKHLTVRDNVAFGLKIRRRPKAEIAEKVDNLLEVVGLSGFQSRYPSQLSGGQRQRMALARALAVDPQVLLLDEPFGALDAKVREDLRAWLRRLHDEVHVTTVLVTHDQAEALDVADRIAVLKDGRIEQVGSPSAVYDTPANAFVMSFLGAVSSLNGALVRPHDIRVGRNPDMAIAADEGTAESTGVVRATIDRVVDAGIRGAGGVDQRRHRRAVHRSDHPRRCRSAGSEGGGHRLRACHPGAADPRRERYGGTTLRPTWMGEARFGHEHLGEPHRIQAANGLGCRRIEAIQHRLGYQPVRAERRCHRNPCRCSVFRHPIGQPPGCQEPWRDHHAAGAAAPQPLDGLGR